MNHEKFPKNPDLDKVYEVDGNDYTLLSIAVLFGMTSKNPDNLKIMKLLYDRGASLDMPYDNSARSTLKTISSDIGRSTYGDANGVKFYDIRLKISSSSPLDKSCFNTIALISTFNMLLNSKSLT